MKRILVVLGLVALTFGSAEIGARYFLGLGTPPLSIAHPTIEYMFTPKQDLYRFGNHQVYNEYGMRSPHMDQVFQSQRVMVFGDSVLNGGNLTDQDALATTLASNAKVFYGNVSAGSWGPANMMAWIDEYGLLDAEIVIVLLSSHDLYDIPTFETLNTQTHPTQKPLSALVEGFERYLPKYLPRVFVSQSLDSSLLEKITRVSAAGAMTDFIDRVEVAEIKLCAILH